MNKNAISASAFYILIFTIISFTSVDSFAESDCTCPAAPGSDEACENVYDPCHSTSAGVGGGESCGQKICRCDSYGPDAIPCKSSEPPPLPDPVPCGCFVNGAKKGKKCREAKEDVQNKVNSYPEGSELRQQWQGILDLINCCDVSSTTNPCHKFNCFFPKNIPGNPESYESEDFVNVKCSQQGEFDCEVH